MGDCLSCESQQNSPYSRLQDGMYIHLPPTYNIYHKMGVGSLLGYAIFHGEAMR